MALPFELDLLDRGARYSGVGDVVILKMPEDSFEMIHFEGTTHALRGLSGGHHKMFDEKLAASVEQVAQRYLSVRSIDEWRSSKWTTTMETLLGRIHFISS
jgi:hypothetical protein